MVSPATFEEFPGGRLDKIFLSMFVSPSTGPAVASGYVVYAGLTLSETAWDPEIQTDFRFLWHQVVFPQIGGTGAADSNASRWIGYFPLMARLQPRRRIQAEQSLFINVKNSVASAAGIQYSLFVRCLIAAGAR
jgi:hypothetical protein